MKSQSRKDWGWFICIKNLEMTVTGTRGFNEAIITQGGVNVKEINPINYGVQVCTKCIFCRRGA